MEYQIKWHVDPDYPQYAKWERVRPDKVRELVTRHQLASDLFSMTTGVVLHGKTFSLRCAPGSVTVPPRVRVAIQTKVDKAIPGADKTVAGTFTRSMVPASDTRWLELAKRLEEILVEQAAKHKKEVTGGRLYSVGTPGTNEKTWVEQSYLERAQHMSQKDAYGLSQSARHFADFEHPRMPQQNGIPEQWREAMQHCTDMLVNPPYLADGTELEKQSLAYNTRRRGVLSD